jgi:hypothetical protein
MENKSELDDFMEMLEGIGHFEYENYYRSPVVSYKSKPVKRVRKLNWKQLNPKTQPKKIKRSKSKK